MILVTGGAGYIGWHTCVELLDAGFNLVVLDKLLEQPVLITVNLGTGRGYSVLEMVKAFEQASNRPVNYQIVDRRPGDVEQCYADPAYALATLDWQAEFDIDRMCEDAWRWQSQNSEGFC